MAVTVAINHSDLDYNVVKNQYKARGTITFDTVYVANGEAADFTSTAIMTGAGGAFTTVQECIVTNNSVLAADAGLMCTYDNTNKKFFLFESGADGAALDEIGADDVSSVVVAFQVTGV